MPDDADIFFFGRRNLNDLDVEGMPAAAFADNISDKVPEGIDCRINLFGENIDVHISLPGLHNINNALAAAMVADSLGLSTSQIQNGIAKCTTISGRSNIIRQGELLVMMIAIMLALYL